MVVSGNYLDRIKGGTLKYVMADLHHMRQMSLAIDDAQLRVNLIEVIDRLITVFMLPSPANMGAMGVLQNLVRREIASMTEDSSTKGRRDEYAFSLSEQGKERYYKQLVVGTGIVDEIAAAHDGIVPAEWAALAGFNRAKNLSAATMMGLFSGVDTGYEE